MRNSLILNNAIEYPVPHIESELKLPTLISRCKEVLIRDLLPYDPSKKSGTYLNEYAFILQITSCAIKSLKDNEFHRFDPLVGDNACQIRASYLALTFRVSQKNIKALKDKISFINKELEKYSIDGTKKTLNEILVGNDFDIKLTEEELFLILSYILTIVKVSLKSQITKKEKTDHKLLAKFDNNKNISNSFLKYFTNHARNLLAEASIISVRKIAELIDENIIKEMTSEKYTIIHRNMNCISMFWGALALYRQAVVNNIPLVLWAEHIDENFEKQEEFFALFQSNGKRYVEIPSDTFSDAPAIILQGSCHKEIQNRDEWRKELVKYDPYELFLSYAALHRQYPCETKDSIILERNDEIFNHYYKIGNELGCGLEKPEFFFVTHVFLDTFANVSSKNSDSW